MKKKLIAVAGGIEVVKLDELVPDPANARAHGKSDQAALAASFTEFGAARSATTWCALATARSKLRGRPA